MRLICYFVSLLRRPTIPPGEVPEPRLCVFAGTAPAPRSHSLHARLRQGLTLDDLAGSSVEQAVTLDAVTDLNHSETL